MKLFKNRHLWIAVAAMACWPVLASGQSGSVVLRGSVSEVVALSAANSPAAAARVVVTGDRRALSVHLNGNGEAGKSFRVPVLIRSNAGYALSAAFQSVSKTAASLSISAARPTGRFVAADATANMLAESGLFPLDLSGPRELFRGNRISLAGTLDSPENALELTLLISVVPEPGRKNWSVDLTISATPAGSH